MPSRYRLLYMVIVNKRELQIHLTVNLMLYPVKLRDDIEFVKASD